ncbi:methylated-DNA--[protein]-cysteine S-methyltransferase [Catelliglobosispora koreensis]|uniref:methylated-DNA--[protein]-cysteine S-methyltransferase n=1 Tax=Catelliglobosispora koreensis TaxID=129052 RepID=UPI0003716B70|nr:methylated-DNA--[protein]-cysteine S-methyltransferase [Catelliglobosispora koreensis]
MITLSTPAGPFTMTGNGVAVTAARFHSDDLPTGDVPQSAIDAVKSYLDGDIAALDDVPVLQHGSPYLSHCWEILRTLREPVTYTTFAALTGKGPQAARAAAQGCARNTIALFVPCHRVLRTDGSLGGYRWGLPVKQWLLRHETEFLLDR